MIIDKTATCIIVSNPGHPRLTYKNRMDAIAANIAQQRHTPYLLPDECETRRAREQEIMEAGKRAAAALGMRRA